MKDICIRINQDNNLKTQILWHLKLSTIQEFLRLMVY